jgi:AraC-like DNA-binding protein
MIVTPIVAQQRFASFEVLASTVESYDIDIKQIDCGSFTAFMQQIQCGAVCISRFSTNRRIEANGNPPRGVRTFGIPTARCQPFIWRGKRSHALRTAIDYIQSEPDGILSVSSFCQLTGIHERTLQRAFLESYDMTPKSYMRIYRLNQAYKTLLRSDPDTTRVTDVAIDLGYCHLSQFATDYRRHFGELPSETLYTN